MVTQHEIIAYYRIDLWLAVKNRWFDAAVLVYAVHSPFYSVSIVQPTTVLKIDCNHYTLAIYIG